MLLTISHSLKTLSKGVSISSKLSKTLKLHLKISILFFNKRVSTIIILLRDGVIIHLQTGALSNLANGENLNLQLRHKTLILKRCMRLCSTLTKMPLRTSQYKSSYQIRHLRSWSDHKLRIIWSKILHKSTWRLNSFHLSVTNHFSFPQDRNRKLSFKS